MSEVRIGTTYRTRDGKSRATYRPDWSHSLPWCVYENGTATVCLGCLGAVRLRLRNLETDAERAARLAAVRARAGDMMIEPT